MSCGQMVGSMKIAELSPGVADAERADSRGTSSVRVAGALSAVTIFTAVSGLLTGPLLARALEPTGRGLLAAILVPVGLAATVGQLGMAAFVARESARGTDTRKLVPTIGVLVIGMGLAILAVVAALLAGPVHMDPVVEHYLLLGMALLPGVLLSSLLADVCWGQRRWRTLIAARLLPPIVYVIATVTLYVTDALTLQTAALVNLSGALAALPLLLMVQRQNLRPRFFPRLAWRGMRFGLQAWPGSLAALANGRLDQLLMIPLASPRQLGLYAVAVAVSSFSSFIVPSIATAAFPQLARGNTGGFPATVRVTFALLILIGATIAALVPFVIDGLFGSAFSDAKVLAWILIVAEIPHGLTILMMYALTAANHPRRSTYGELVTLVITVPGLLIFLPLGGATAAALVTLVAYTIAYLVVMPMCISTLDLRIRSIIPTTTDFQLAFTMAYHRLRLS